jgi:hypothetical protein
MEKLWLSVKEQVDAEQEWKPRIHQQQTLLLSRLKRLGPEALERLKAQRAAVHAELGLTETEGEGEVKEGDERKSRGSAVTREDNELSTSPRRFPSRSMQRNRTDSVNSNDAPLAAVSKPEAVPLTSASEAVSQESISQMSGSFGGQLTNEQLAHELTLDPEFALKKPQRTELEESVRNMARKAYFDSVREAFEKEQYSTYIPEFIDDIKKQLLSMVNEKGKIASDLNEYLDIALIRQQIEHKNLNLPNLLTYIITKMGMLCAPVRDPSIQAIKSIITSSKKSSDLVAAFDSILEILEDMKLDLANHRLQQLRPHMKIQAVNYEKNKFKEALGKSTVSLEKTKKWLSEAVAEKRRTLAARNPENVDIPENTLKFTDTFHDAILSLVFGNTAVTPETLPETLIMDGQRLFGFQNQGQMITVVASLLMLTQNTVSELRGDKAFVVGLKDTLMALLKDPEGLTVENISAQIVASSSTMLKQRRSKELDEERIGMIKSMVEKTLSTRDPIFNLLRRRIMACVKAHVVSGTFKREGLERAGLDLVRSELESFSYKVALWVRFNGEVYNEWYDLILKELTES